MPSRSPRGRVNPRLGWVRLLRRQAALRADRRNVRTPRQHVAGPKAAHAVGLRLWSVSCLLLALHSILIAWTAVSGSAPGRHLEAFVRTDRWWPEAILSGLLLLTFTTFWWPRRRQPRPFSLVSAGALATLAVVMGLASYAPCNSDRDHLFAPVTATLALFVGSVRDAWSAGPCSQPPPLAIEVAMLAALLTTFVGLGAVLVAVTTQQWDRLRLRLTRSVILFHGLDETTLPLVRVLARKNAKDAVAVVEAAESSLHAAARFAGARVLVADLSDIDVVRSIATRRNRLKVRSAYLMSASATRNLEILSALTDGLQAEGSVASRADGIASRIVVRVDDPWLVEDWRRQALDARYRPWVVEAVSIYAATARVVLDRIAGSRMERLLLVGATPLTLALLSEQAASAREHASTLELGITGATMQVVRDVFVLAPDAAELVEDHELQQQRFGNTDLGFAIHGINGDLTENAIAQVLGSATAYVLISERPSARTALLAARVSARHPECVVDVWEDVTGDNRVLPIRPLLRSFALTFVSEQGLPVEDAWERVARLLHESYVAAYPVPPGQPVPAGRRPWQELDVFYRESGLRQIRTVLEQTVRPGSARSWGPVTQGSEATDLSAEELDGIAEAEHSSWLTYYRHNHWVRADPTEDTAAARARRRHRMLVHWSALSEEDREPTRQGIRTVLHLLAMLGYRAHRQARDVDWSSFRRVGTVAAEQLTTPLTWHTPGGDRMTGQVGDWLVRDGDDVWTVAPDEFERTYRANAEGFERTGHVTARPGTPGEVIETLEGPATVSPGDWVVRATSGVEWPVPATRFARTYEPLP